MTLASRQDCGVTEWRQEKEKAAARAAHTELPAYLRKRGRMVSGPGAVSMHWQVHCCSTSLAVNTQASLGWAGMVGLWPPPQLSTCWRMAEYPAVSAGGWG